MYSHLKALDSLRGIAALIVLTEHYVISYGLPCQDLYCQATLDAAPFNFWWNGASAVSMFFVLSGFVLSLKYFRPESLSLPINLSSFLIARICRIWLPYLFTLFICGVAYIWWLPVSDIGSKLESSTWIQGLWRSHNLSVEDMLKEANLLNLPDLIVLIPQAWTLTIEMSLSLLMPFAILMARQHIGWLLVFLGYLLILTNTPIYWLHFNLGILLAKYLQTIIPFFHDRPFWRPLLFVSGLILFTSSYSFASRLSESVVWILTGLGAVAILTYVMVSHQCRRLLEASLLKKLGLASYSIYLNHMLILMLVTPLWLRLIEKVVDERWLLWSLGYVGTVAIAMGVSLVSYSFVERPSIELGKWLIRKVN